MCFVPGRREDGQQLVERQKRFPHIEFEVQVSEICDVRYKGAVVVRVEPGPALTTVIVIVKVPLYGTDVPFCLRLEHFPVNTINSIIATLIVIVFIVSKICNSL